MNRKIIILYILLLLPFYIPAQIGINTESPIATLEVKSELTTVPAILARNSANVELIRLLDNGNLGIAKANPAVRVDLRGALSNGELGLGTTTMTAAAARAGAIRYNNGIEYSDGDVWIKLTALPPKAYVIAKNTVQIGVPASKSVIWKNWTEAVDVTNSFDASTGVFTAPRAGIYSVSCTGMVENIVTTSGVLRIELNLMVTSVTASQVKSAFAAPNNFLGASVNMTFVNKAFLYLQTGDKCYFTIWNGMNVEVKTTTDGSYNTLTISEM
ncbi:hypothetical protein G7050_13140 [Dysgonomonas sp. HDW5A]|uniref:hypothetical protein n=1 Tax=Dysgonomonas sp. HDW5A TaxID=2714926 RepID=UPI00140AE91C|nr:hypothetical protein [Dysgonomonas sp. HDW5A]QIK60727.1 hypothetical protein G7050_13140 [Dysgonomonas sp. HDW5A]